MKLPGQAVAYNTATRLVASTEPRLQPHWTPFSFVNRATAHPGRAAILAKRFLEPQGPQGLTQVRKHHIEPLHNYPIASWIALSRRVFSRIAHNTQLGGGECLFLLAGHRHGDVLLFERAEPLLNRTTAPRRFRIAVRDAHHLSVQLGLPEVGVYHSHARGIVPSSIDLASIARFPEWIWLIGCPLGASVHVAAYQQVAGRIRSIPVSRAELCND